MVRIESMDFAKFRWEKVGVNFVSTGRKVRHSVVIDLPNHGFANGHLKDEPRAELLHKITAMAKRYYSTSVNEASKENFEMTLRSYV